MEVSIGKVSTNVWNIVSIIRKFGGILIYIKYIKTVIYGRPAKGVFDSQQTALFMGNYALGGDGQCVKALR